MNSRRWAVSSALAAGLFAALVLACACAQPTGIGTAPQGMTAPSATRTVPSAATTTSPGARAPLTFAVIGDYGTGDSHEAAVARLVASWGADVVISGHAHMYERIARDGIVYFVDGLGGATRYAFGSPVSGSLARYDADWGAQRVTVTDTAMDFEFLSVGGAVIDHYRVSAQQP